MNSFQMIQQIKARLEALRWNLGSADLVFGDRGSVVVVAGTIPSAEDMPRAFPACFISFGSGTNDQEDPQILRQQFHIVVLARVTGSRFGEFALIGGARPDLGRSAGAGIGEIDARVRQDLDALTGFNGTPIIVGAASVAAPSVQNEISDIVLSEFVVEAVVSNLPFYTPPQELAVSGATWTWNPAGVADRFDFLSYALAYKTGATPVQDINDVDGVIAAGLTSPTTSHTPVAGRAYSVFASYGGRGVLAGVSDGDYVGAFVTT